MKSLPRPDACALVGILDDGWAGLSGAARQCLAAADLVIGAGRTLELVRPHLPFGSVVRAMDGALGQVPEWIATCLLYTSPSPRD